MIDHASAWTDLAAWIAEEPNRGRAQVLQRMAELAKLHTVEEDDLERALRLVGPRMQELLFNRVPALAAALAHLEESTAVPEGSAVRRPEAVRRSMAVA